MKYYLMKLYESKRKASGLKIGLSRFSVKKRVIVICLFGLMFLAFALYLVMLRLTEITLSNFELAIMIIIEIWLSIIIKKEENLNLDSNISEYIKKIDVLYEILTSEFKIDNKARLEYLISLYKEEILKKEKEESAKSKILVTLLTVLSGILQISFVNMSILKMDLYVWIQFAVIVIVGFSLILGFVYILKKIDSVDLRYQRIVSDLEYLLLSSKYEAFK